MKYFIKLLFIFAIILPKLSTAQCEQVTILIDNSGSIQPQEWDQYASIINNTIDEISQVCSSIEIATINYGGAFGDQIDILSDYDQSINISSITRTYENSGDDLNGAIGKIITAIETGDLSHDQNCTNTIAIFTDAGGGTGCNGEPGQTCITPYDNINLSKDLYYEHVFVVGIEDGDNESELLGYIHGDGSYIPIAFDDNANTTALTITNEVAQGCNDCPDISGSLISNADFEDTTCEPVGAATDGNPTLSCAVDWSQATDATSDFFSTVTYPNLISRDSTIYELENPAPPNGSEHYVGSYILPTQNDYNEYVGGCLTAPILANTEFTLVLDLGAPAPEVGTNGITYAPEVLIGEIVVLGIPNCSFPISGLDCKEDNYEVIGRQSINIQGGTWQQGVEITITANQQYPAIMYGLSCNTGITENTYLLSDNILVIEGENPCPMDTDPCNDISASLIPNPDFEILIDSTDLPNDLGQLDKLQNWVQATDGTSDFLNFVSIESPRDFLHVGDISNRPPNGSDNFVGLHFNFPNTIGVVGEYVEYVGSCTNGKLLANTDYTIEFYMGTTDGSSSTYSNLGFDGELVFLGIPDCSMLPINGTDCKEDDFDVIGRTSVKIPSDTWLNEKINVQLNGQSDYEAIIFGPSCTPYPNAGDNERTYFLIDEILVVKGDIDCGTSCFSINAESPPCNIENEATYSYNFTFTNTGDQTYEKLLLFDNDVNFKIDTDNTLIALEDAIAPGQSVNLTWDINAINFQADTYKYCFYIAPYNTGGPCCKEQHCIELISCCDPEEVPSCTLTESISETEGEQCCYDFAYSYTDCLSESFNNITVNMLTDGLGISGIGHGIYDVTTINENTLYINNSEEPLPSGENILAFTVCLEGLTSSTPETQMIRIDWGGEVGEQNLILSSSEKELTCTPPEDECTVVTDARIYCGDDGLYHYEFKVTNVSDRQKDASIIVLDNGGNPGDFVPQTFPPFPDHRPNGVAYLPYGETTELLDIALPNATLGSSYEFFISLHDYRNVDPEDGDYWCCFTPDTITIDIDILCDEDNLTSEPLDHLTYPNPVIDQLKIEFNEALETDTKLLIQGIEGATINQKQLVKGTKEDKLNTSDLTPGLYFLKFVDKNGKVKHSMFVKE